MSARIASSWWCLASICLGDLRFGRFQTPTVPAAGEPAELTGLDDGEDTAGRSLASVPLQIEAEAAESHHGRVIPAALLTERAGDPAVSGEPSSSSSTRGIIATLAPSVAVALGLIAFRRGRASRLAAVIACGVVVAGAAGLPDCDVARGRPGPLLFRAARAAAAHDRGSQVRDAHPGRRGDRRDHGRRRGTRRLRRRQRPKPHRVAAGRMRHHHEHARPSGATLEPRGSRRSRHIVDGGDADRRHHGSGSCRLVSHRRLGRGRVPVRGAAKLAGGPLFHDSDAGPLGPAPWLLLAWNRRCGRTHLGDDRAALDRLAVADGLGHRPGVSPSPRRPGVSRLGNRQAAARASARLSALPRGHSRGTRGPGMATRRCPRSSRGGRAHGPDHPARGGRHRAPRLDALPRRRAYVPGDPALRKLVPGLAAARRGGNTLVAHGHSANATFRRLAAAAVGGSGDGRNRGRDLQDGLFHRLSA